MLHDEYMSFRKKWPLNLSESADVLETLAFAYKTDKSQDDHKYVGLYAMLLDHLREQTTNMTEIGVAAGQSLWMWHEFFPRARIWGIDIKLREEVRKAFRKAAQVHLLQADATLKGTLQALGFADNSMDVIIDDGLHEAQANEQVLLNFWPSLRCGGFYFIEDIQTGSHGGMDGRYSEEHAYATGANPLTHDSHFLSEATRDIFTKHADVFFADTMVGHRAFDEFRERLSSKYMRDRVNHHSHILVLRKRHTPRERDVQMHFGVPDGAMGWVPQQAYAELAKDSGAREAAVRLPHAVPRMPSGTASMRAGLSVHGWLRRASTGYCGATEPVLGDCIRGSSGSFGLWPSHTQTWQLGVSACLEACSACPACKYVSISMIHADCSWYRACPALLTDVKGFRSARAGASSPPLV